MISYRYPGYIFHKAWYWFTAPSQDLSGDMVNVFSYDKVDLPGFRRKDALTTCIDLTKSEEELWQALRKRYVREQIGKGERNGITITIGDDWKNFVQVYRDFRKGKHLHEDSPKVFQYCLVVTASYEGKIVAGGAFVADKTYMRALALASVRFVDDGKKREVIGQANRMIIWETMRFAKREGYTSFDLGGIDPESNDSKERGLAEFKEAFGGVRKMCYYYSKVNSPVLRFLLRAKGG